MNNDYIKVYPAIKPIEKAFVVLAVLFTMIGILIIWILMIICKKKRICCYKNDQNIIGKILNDNDNTSCEDLQRRDSVLSLKFDFNGTIPISQQDSQQLSHGINASDMSQSLHRNESLDFEMQGNEYQKRSIKSSSVPSERQTIHM